MSTGTTSREDADLKEFLSRQSPVSAAYASLGLVESPSTLDDKILAAAKIAAKPPAQSVAKPVPKPGLKPAPVPQPGATPRPEPGKATPAQPDAAAESAERRKRPRHPKPEAQDEKPPTRRPPWLVPVALAASVLVAVGVGLVVLTGPSSDTDDAPLDGSLFARRARERSDESKAAAAAAAEQDATAVEVERAPLPPPPIFAPDVPQVEDLDAAIAMIRKELMLVNQLAVAQEEAAQGVIQPRNRRLTKILELYDGGNPELAGDSLEIFLRDFADDPISQRILGVKP